MKALFARALIASVSTVMKFCCTQPAWFRLMPSCRSLFVDVLQERRRVGRGRRRRRTSAAASR